jgi:ribonuclease-3
VSTGVDRLALLEAALGYSFRCRDLIEQALRHSSAAYESGAPSNERLEFLGDAALSHAVAAILFARWPEATEGELTRARAALVRESTLAKLARELAMDRVLETASGLQPSDSLLADAFESLLGAVLLDGGWRAFKIVVRRLLGPAVRGLRREELALGEPKSTLQELAQRRGLPLPVYREVATSGPAHRRVYTFEVEFDGEPLARGRGSSKRSAQQAAARHALELLDGD